jgi:hypothetical protein
MQVILAALNDIKYSYLQVINPLLTHSILVSLRELPDQLRTNKKLFKEIVNAISPDIPYAKIGANASIKGFHKRSDCVELMRKTLKSEQAQLIFDRKFI